MAFGQPVPAIDVAAARGRDGGAVLLDVREDDEWAAGHAPDARHVPMSRLGDHAAELPRDTEIVVICRSGNRSAAVTEALVGAGFTAVNMAGGMQAWAAAGYPVVTDAGAPGAVI
ncbi:MAG TPA: rhodanese-like domain-containing protein [Acidimicrobiales bacterium]|nr:rhodanese-like domain-containing protein [Acidimicrobiales bacterium]